MRIKTVKYTNYRQHKDLFLDFDSNVVAMVGSNGSGKSNAFGGIEFCLTGSQPGANKSELTTWGEKNGNVTMTLEHRGVDYVISRDTNTNKASFKEGDLPEITGIREVSEAINNKLVDLDLLKQAVFVNQAQLDSILFSKATERSRAFQRLIGLQDATKIYDRMGIELGSGKLEPPPNYDELIKNTEANIEAARSEIIELEESKKKYGEVILDDQQYLALKKSMEDLADKANLQAKAKRILDELHSLENTKRTLESTAVGPAGGAEGLEALKDRYKQVKDARSELSPALERVRYICDWVNNKITAEVRYRDAVDARDKHIGSVGIVGLEGEVDAFRKDVDRLTKEEISYRNRYSVLQLFISQANKAKSAGLSATCPTCGSEVVEVNQETLNEFDELNKIVDDIDNQLVVARDNLKNGENTLSVFNINKQRLEAAVFQAKNTLDGFNTRPATLPDDGNMWDMLPHELDKIIEGGRQECDSLDLEAGDLLGKIRTIESNQESYTKHINALQGVIANIANTTNRFNSLNLGTEIIDNLTYGEDFQPEIDKCKDMESKHLAAKTAYDMVCNSLAAKVKSVDKLNETLVGYRAQKEESEVLRKKIETLKTVRNWFHHSNGPGTVISVIMDRITPTVNYFLDKLDAPFTVEANKETLAFTYTMKDLDVVLETPPDANSLSGAQKAMLALSFRLACYHMFSSQLGVLIMDEPLAHWDGKNVEKFGELLQRLQTMTHELGFQLIISTHHVAILPFCDKIVRIGDNKDRETEDGGNDE